MSGTFLRTTSQSLFLLLPFVAGCVLTDGLKREPSPTQSDNVRLVDDGKYEPLDPQLILTLKKSLQQACASRQPPNINYLPPINVLAISGGGSYGTFDVGVLKGWSELGSRPTFDIVTGISTGAMIGTLAFLGPRYDDALRDAYVYARADDVFETRPWLSILFSDSYASSKPLKKKIDQIVTSELLREVAQAHAEGRRLYVGTTNLDTRRFVIWDMGAIASSGKPDALELFRKIILASASVPGFFPPVLIDIEVDGKKYQELHVDGGSTTAVFVPMAMTKCDPNNPGLRPGSNVYVISSGKLFADSDTVKRQFVNVSADAISAMLYAGTRNDIFRIFNQALLCGMDFHLMAIPQEFPLNSDSLSFEPDELRKLYELGCKMGKSREAWRETPPGTEISEQTIPRTGTRFKAEK
jgi:predicted patatin/cPLA2 family phospholipase